MEVLQAGLILVAYLILVDQLGDRAAVVSYALATFVVSAATLVLVFAVPDLTRGRDQPPSPLPSP